MKHLCALARGASRHRDEGEANLRLPCRPPLRLGSWLGILVLLALACPARAQVYEAGNAGGFSINVGAMASGYSVGYGNRKLLGYSVFVDMDTRRRFGVEAEGRQLRYQETHNVANVVAASTYLVGGRYHFDFKQRFRFYGKGLVGIGQFRFPYGLAQGNYLVVAPGGGVDYHLSGRYFWRADAEYQIWPSFNWGTTTQSMSSYGVSTGLRIRVF